MGRIRAYEFDHLHILERGEILDKFQSIIGKDVDMCDHLCQYIRNVIIGNDLIGST